MSTKNKKITRCTKKKKKFEETQQASEPDIEEILELSDQEFKTTMIIMPEALMHKLNNKQEQMGNVSVEMEILRKKKQKKWQKKKKKTNEGGL